MSKTQELIPKRTSARPPGMGPPTAGGREQQLEDEGEPARSNAGSAGRVGSREGRPAGRMLCASGVSWGRLRELAATVVADPELAWRAAFDAAMLVLELARASPTAQAARDAARKARREAGDSDLEERKQGASAAWEAVLGIAAAWFPEAQARVLRERMGMAHEELVQAVQRAAGLQTVGPPLAAAAEPESAPPREAAATGARTALRGGAQSQEPVPPRRLARSRPSAAKLRGAAVSERRSGAKVGAAGFREGQPLAARRPRRPGEGHSAGAAARGPARDVAERMVQAAVTPL